MTNSEIQNAIGFKQDRVQILKNKRQLLVDLEKERSVSKWKRSFQNFYYNSRNFILLGLAIFLLAVALIGLATSNLFFINSDGYQKIAVSDFRTTYKDKTQKTLDESFALIQKKDKSFTVAKMQQGIDQTIQQNAFEKGQLIIRISAVFLIILSIMTWVAASFSKKMKVRNELAVKTDGIIHEIIQDYELILQEEEREIIELKNKLS